MQVETISRDIKKESFITLSDSKNLQKLKKQKYLKQYRQEVKNRKKRVEFSLNIEEYQELEKEACKQNTSVNQLSKKMIFAYKNKKYLLPQNLSEELQKFTLLIRNIANNINQIAKHSNSVKKILNIPKILKNLQSVDEKVKKFVSNPPLDK